MTDREQRLKELREGTLGKQFYVIYTVPVAPRSDIEPLLLDHLEHQVRLEKSGVLFAAGPLQNKAGEKMGHGMIVIRADSFEEADSIAAEDPFHKAGVREYTIDRWTVNEGRVNLTIDYSDQSVSLS